MLKLRSHASCHFSTASFTNQMDDKPGEICHAAERLKWAVVRLVMHWLLLKCIRRDIGRQQRGGSPLHLLPKSLLNSTSITVCDAFSEKPYLTGKHRNFSMCISSPSASLNMTCFCFSLYYWHLGYVSTLPHHSVGSFR